MAKIKPFQAIRPKQGLESKIAALPYDVYSREEAKEEVKKEPMSFLKIDRAETQFSDDVDTYAPCVYEKAHDTLWEMIKNGEFITETTPCYYVYELIMEGRSQTGIVACASIDDYCSQTIKKHENTRADKEVDRIKHVNTCEAQTGPIFLAYRAHEVINHIVVEKKKETPVYDFVSTDKIIHKVWVMKEKESIDAIKKAFESINAVYIADGHHRCASAVKVGLKRREQSQDYTGEEEFNYFLSVLFPDEQLMIMDYNRAVKDLNGYTYEEFIKALSEKFDVTDMGSTKYKPEKKGTMSMYLDKHWYRLTAKSHILSEDPVDGLDVAILQNEVLCPMLGIENPKTDRRIDFIGGIRGLGELEKRVSDDCKVAFAIYPTSIHELFDVADANLLMPPKSTWFEPKLRSGLFIHSIKE